MTRYSLVLLLLFGCHAPESDPYVTPKQIKAAQAEYEMKLKCAFALAEVHGGRADILIRHEGGWILCRK